MFARPFTPLPILLLLLANQSLCAMPAQALEHSSRSEPGEQLSGGTAGTRALSGRKAFSHPSAGMDSQRRLDFTLGRALFNRLWVTAPASTRAADGLGPLYNARSCSRCHRENGRGRPPTVDDAAEDAVSLVLRLAVPATDGTAPEPVYGTQLQDFAVPGHVAEGRVRIEYAPLTVVLAGGTPVELRKPVYRVTNLGYGPLHPAVQLSPRVAPPLIGLGLLELIEEKDLLARADPHDADGDGISGRPNRVWSAASGQSALGRYGWKAGAATIDEQNQAAFATDIGISAPLFPAGAGDCTEHQTACLQAPNGNSPQYANLEADRQVTDLVLFYTRHLAVPARRNVDDGQVLVGERLFHETGCAACHVSQYRTATAADRPDLSDRIIRPYTDLLLHDMGEGLADGGPAGRADGREWRTPPLWGIGLTEQVSGHTRFLHDGRARNLLEAVLWHGGEAEVSRDRVVAMDADERQALLAFLNSL